MTHSLQISIAQLNPLVGDIEGNAQLVLEYAAKAAKQGADLLVFPELMLTGYPPEDLLLRPSLQLRVEQALELLTEHLPMTVVLGFPWSHQGQLFNAAAFVGSDGVSELYFKQCLPNYRVFDEKRYFAEGSSAVVSQVAGVKVGLSVCEDIWYPQPSAQAKAAGAQIMVNINASPFHGNKAEQRLEAVAQRAQEIAIPVVYGNLVGGQDELVFDGGSFVMAADGEVVMRAPTFEAGLFSCSFDEQLQPQAGVMALQPGVEASIYQALVLGVRDYVNKNGFKGAVLGLSGGIDSALTLAVAVDALGAGRVEAVMMPYHFTSQMSLEDAQEEADILGVRYSVIPIEAMFDSFVEALAEEFAGLPRDTTEENLQSRCRGVMLMAISNKKGYIVLTTGNKSEMAVGYATLYGDMAGGFCVLKDVYKTLVFRLCRYRNSLQAQDVIPERVIIRPPSAELAPDQEDTDSLPPYEQLDEILRRYIECDEGAEAIIAAGFSAEDVYRIVRLVDLNEYKRRQSPVGPRVTQRSFGKDRRYPITNGWKAGV